jgi:uncharacterized protein YkwD
MTRRWTARYAALAAASALIAAAVIGSLLLFTERESAQRSAVAGTHIVRAWAPAEERRLGSIDDAASPRGAPVPLTDADVLVWFDALLHGPAAVDREPTVGEVLVFFDALLAEPGPTAQQPSVADTLIFFHALLYGGDASAAPIEPMASEPVLPTPPSPPRRATVAPAPTATPPPPPVPVTLAPASTADVWIDPAFTQAVWDGVNARRAQAGLAPVAVEGRLHTAAASYAVLMAEQRWFSHTGPDGSSFVDRIVAAGFPFTVQVGEVLAMGSHGWPAPEVVQAWIDSPPHREQLLNPAYTRAGVECAFSEENGALMVRCAMEFAAGQ